MLAARPQTLTNFKDAGPKMLGVHDISTSHPSRQAPHRRPSWLHADHRPPRLLWPPMPTASSPRGMTDSRLLLITSHSTPWRPTPCTGRCQSLSSFRSPLLSTVHSWPAIHPVRRTCCYRCRYALLALHTLKLVDAPLSWVSPLALTHRALQTYVRSIEAWQCATLVLLGPLAAYPISRPPPTSISRFVRHKLQAFPLPPFHPQISSYSVLLSTRNRKGTYSASWQDAPTTPRPGSKAKLPLTTPDPPQTRTQKTTHGHRARPVKRATTTSTTTSRSTRDTPTRSWIPLWYLLGRTATTEEGSTTMHDHRRDPNDEAPSTRLPRSPDDLLPRSRPHQNQDGQRNGRRGSACAEASCSCSTRGES